jgi:type I restriction enzyme S subunit
MSNNDILLDEKCDFVNDEAIKRINQRSDLRIGDLLFSGIGTIGRVYLIDIPTHNWNISESVFTMRANNLVSKEYLYLLLLSEDMQSYCDQNAHGAAQRGIRMADLRAYKFMLPPEQIMIEFTSKVSSIINSAQACRKRIKFYSER